MDRYWKYFLFILFIHMACRSSKGGVYLDSSYSMQTLRDSLQDHHFYLATKNISESNSCFFDNYSIPDWLSKKATYLQKKLEVKYSKFRRVTKRNLKALSSSLAQQQETSEIVSTICIDRSGNGVFVFLEKETTAKIKPRDLEPLMMALLGYKYSPQSNADCIECGKLIIKLYPHNVTPNF